MRKMMLLAAMVAMAALMLAAAPAMANDHDKKFFDHDKKFFDHDKKFFDHDDDDRNFFDDDDVRFVFRDDDDFDFDFDSDFEQEADSGDVDQSFVVTNTGDNSNQCVGLQGVANTGNAQNQLGITQLGNGFGDFDRDRFFHDHDRWWDHRFDRFDFDDGDIEFEDVGSDITVSPTNLTTCDQQVNQAAAASSW
jgi:spore coat protein C